MYGTTDDPHQVHTKKCTKGTAWDGKTETSKVDFCVDGCRYADFKISKYHRDIKLRIKKEQCSLTLIIHHENDTAVS